MAAPAAPPVSVSDCPEHIAADEAVAEMAVGGLHGLVQVKLSKVAVLVTVDRNEADTL